MPLNTSHLVGTIIDFRNAHGGKQQHSGLVLSKTSIFRVTEMEVMYRHGRRQTWVTAKMCDSKGTLIAEDRFLRFDITAGITEWVHVVSPGPPVTDNQIAQLLFDRLENPCPKPLYPELVDKMHGFYLAEAKRILPTLTDPRSRDFVETLIRVHTENA